SVDLCSVSACFPHVITYPEPGFRGGHAETGSLTCPATPPGTNPCLIRVRVNVADVGSLIATSLLQEVGGYALGSAPRRGRRRTLRRGPTTSRSRWTESAASTSEARERPSSVALDSIGRRGAFAPLRLANGLRS